MGFADNHTAACAAASAAYPNTYRDNDDAAEKLYKYQYHAPDSRSVSDKAQTADQL